MKIDIAKAIEEKNSRLIKVIPPFIIRWIAKLIHQDEINRGLEEFGHLKGAKFAAATVKELGVNYKLFGEENVDPSRRYIIASNHPLGGLDGIIILEAITKLLGETRCLVNDFLYHVGPLKPIFIPINKYGRQSSEAYNMLHDSLESESQMLYFPAGLCSRKIKGEIVDLEWKLSYLNHALKYKRDILPLYFEGKNSKLFYWLANSRKRLGIKFNFETMLLPDEMFKQKGKQFNLYIGKPFTYEELILYNNRRELSKVIRERVYSLKSQ